MPSRSTYRAQIETLHEFFADWYSGTIDRDALDQLEDVLDDDFEMVTPDGDRFDRTAVVAGIREDYDRDNPGAFVIEIKNVEIIERMGDCAAVRYEEWQESTEGTTRRISTALFKDDPSAPGDLIWLDLHETWLADGSE
ncbi:DUF4440 domain-containing protein [Natrialbaceae archaeon A-CW2]